MCCAFPNEFGAGILSLHNIVSRGMITGITIQVAQLSQRDRAARGG